ncbi:type III PLP-dependent enzyme [Mycobacterium sp. Aquia_213]|uniref:type III PLP-dependent enzyme n=1 Tax=Mycobacterium sp. Aquia_213 TaxID=2991728 RepID=UPI0022719136|nr:type III PLP-dependent enzyme [Mycobacterium sp. Aquia_213]WAC93862.1 type III PLP-dependent enzyme [Mycobacterium sp. Aquia_213]
MHAAIRSQLRDSLHRQASAHQWERLIAEYGTPLLVLDPQRVVAQYRLLSTDLRGFGLHYAVKALPHPTVVTALADCGGGFDVASSGEIDVLRGLGLPMNRCIHTHPIKKPAEIDYAYRAGIRTFVVDNPLEAQKFIGRPADIDVLVRLSFPNPSAKCDLSSKFGVTAAHADAVVKQLIAAGVRFGGFSFHVGSQATSAEPYGRAVRATLELVDHVRRTLGVDARIIDIGGGFPVTYREPVPSMGAISSAIDEAFGSRRSEFTLLAEPGRFLVAECMTLLTSVVGTSAREGQLWHYLDDGVYGSYSSAVSDVEPPILALRELGEHVSFSHQPVTLGGPTCDCVDVVACDYPMPQLAVGDVVVSPMMGAYTMVSASGFNGIAATPVVLAQRSSNYAEIEAANLIRQLPGKALTPITSAAVPP